MSPESASGLRPAAESEKLAKRSSRWNQVWSRGAALLAVAAAGAVVAAKNYDEQDPARTFLNVSYDPTRELYRDLNRVFVADYGESTGKKAEIAQSHGGSSRQSRAVIGGLAADVVTLALHSDVDALRKHGLIAEGWERRLPNDSRPYTSTIVFVVRKGNPRQIHDWKDLVLPGVAVVTPDPRTSGNGKLAFLAAWGSILRGGGTEAQAHAFVAELYRHTGDLAPGARAAATAFVEEKIGDVHLTWENEAQREVEEDKGDLETVYPSSSILAEPYVAWVDANVARKGTEAEAKAYLAFLFTARAQAIIADHGYRAVDPAALAAHADRFPRLDLFPVTVVARDWDDAAEKFFGEHGIINLLFEHPGPRGG